MEFSKPLKRLIIHHRKESLKFYFDYVLAIEPFKNQGEVYNSFKEFYVTF
jgi:hypothetical protein